MKTKYKKTILSVKTVLSLLLVSFFVFSCGDDPIPTPEPKPEPPVTIKDGISWSSTSPDADKELTIWFKASSSSPLYNYTGDVYIHTGVVSEGTWLYVPAAWDQNITQCKMIKVDNEKSTWSIKLSPSIRQWFGSGETPVNKIGIVIRNADGTKKGIENDTFIEGITDGKYRPFQPAAIKEGTLPAGLKQGINIVNNTTVTLVLYDKDKYGARKDFAHVVGDFNNWTLSNDDKSQMFRDNAAGCWWITITGLDPTKEYGFQYYIGNNGKDPIRVADPYSRKILDPANDKYISATTYPNLKPYPAGAIGIVSVLKTVEETYNWQVVDFKVPSRDNLVIYELLLRDFTAGGDLSGAMEKLNYLQSLGVNAIELMPVQEFDGNDSWGYNPAFYFAMDKAYGTDQMYKEFIDECHKRGIAVILDVVYNHATGANPFAKMWWNSATDKTSDNNPFFNIDAPHPFSVFHDFNHSNPLVRDFVKRNLEFLLDEYKVDGFRFDLSKGFTQKQSSDDGLFRVYDADRISYLKEYNLAIKTKKADALVILEHFADDKEETELSSAGMMVWRNNNEAYLEAAMGWKDKADFSRAYYGTSSRPVNSLVSYMESHDEERAAYKQSQYGNGILKTSLDAGMSQLGTNAAFFFTVPGPKMMWQFEELGYDISIDYNGRTGKKPVKWDYYNITQRKQLHDTYARLMKLRKDHPELFNATATLSWQVTPSFWEQGRFITLSSFGNAKQIVVVGNFTNNNDFNATTTFPKTGTWYKYMNAGDTLNVTSTSMPIAVPANSFKIYTTFQE
ncbi:MAG: alpha-amylase [Porphyromonadaceae bacterium]|nr:alpha-amylase [Porphyromonadaceae bacterium]